ncbi:MAG: hypothetical protein A3B25_01015 [Candidatus Ryanbacteria bacterium RIFCSPLOWO2_01_FULL_48_26]|uniref:Uncharacterized protein n=1 Tax=Candidatus Ryanbacteria bacterium RIFCSPLOWO2_01_FULL_48_26 TaxID=1802126 RepID=A0A1G2GRH1_9BACT|nr:MAG: hypothetical protein A3B25_01015 [Candidatus Ryanbacteria bacterium RIFCSPLOWO2_01_FULL_48_26]
MNDRNEQNKFSIECRRHRQFQIGTGIIAALVIAAAWGLRYRLVAIVIACWLFYRLYKMVGRRCGCGRVLGVKRRNEIRLAPDETVSWRSPQGRLRWWIRRVCTETFVICICGKKAVSVKIAKGPISVWHALWVRYTDKKQFYADPNLTFASSQATRNMGTPKDLSKGSEHDTPPFVPWDPPEDVPESQE